MYLSGHRDGYPRLLATVADSDAEVRARAIKEVGDIVRATHREVAGD
jgi:hypothetical protein